MVASDLRLYQGDDQAAQELARSAADVAPKLAVCHAQLRHLHAEHEESARRRLKTIMRLAGSEASRTHAALLLARALTRLGEPEQAADVLDHTARLESNDARVQLERLVNRLATRNPISGLTLAPPLSESGEVVSELLGGPKARLPSPRITESPLRSHSSYDYLLYHRICRELAAGRFGEAVSMLRAQPMVPNGSQKGRSDGSSPSEAPAALSGMDAEGVLELTSTYLAKRPDGLFSAKELLQQEAAQGRRRSTLRSLAARCLETADSRNLDALLASSDPASGTFELEERLLLQLLSGGADQLHPEDRGPLLTRSPILGLALELEAYESNDEQPDSTELSLFRVGQLLGREPTHESLETFVEALESLQLSDPGIDEHTLLAVLRLIQASTSPKDHSSAQAPSSPRALSSADETSSHRKTTGQALLDLGRHSTAGTLGLAGLFLEAEGDPEGSRDAYSRFLQSQEPQDLDEESFSCALRAVAQRALQELSPEEPGKESNLSLDLATTFELLTQTSEPDARIRLLRASDHRGVSLAGALLAHVRSAANKEPPPQLALPPAESQRRESGLQEQPSSRIDLLLSVLPALHQAELGSFDFAPQLQKLAARFPEDATLSALARCLTPLSPTGQVHASSPWLAAVDAAQACLEGSAQTAASALKQVGGVVDSPARLPLEEHLLELSGDTDSLCRTWLDRARDASDPEDRKYAYRRLSALDHEGGKPKSALLWQHTLLEEFPQDLSALLRLEGAFLSEGYVDEWSAQKENIIAALLKIGADEDADVYRVFSGYLALSTLDLKSARQALSPLLEGQRPPLIALRVMQQVARQEGDDELLSEVSLRLLHFSRTDLDQSACLLDAACAQARRGQQSEARALLERSRAIRGSDFASELFALTLSQADEPAQRAEALEGFAHATALPRHAANIYRAAGLAWLDVRDSPRARACFEACLERKPSSSTAFERLRVLYRQAEHWLALRQLLEARLELELSPAQRKELTLELSEILTFLGEPELAKQQLEVVLVEHREDIVLLRAHAEICRTLGQHAAAESSLAALSERLEPGEERTTVLRSLGRLYQHELGAFDRAMTAYEAVLEAQPDDFETAQALVEVYCHLELAEKATSLLIQIIQRLSSDTEKKAAAMQLARLYEDVAKDPRRASATLERARRAWPLDADVLQAMTEFMERQGQENGIRMMVDRTGKEVSRKLDEGRIDPDLLETLARVHQLCRRHDASRLVLAARSAYVGQPVKIPAAGPAALSPDIEDGLAPTALPPPLRALLRKTGAVLDAAFPIDLSSLDAQPIDRGIVFERLAHIISSLHLPLPQLLVTEALGYRCAPLTISPSRLLVGSRMETLDEEVIDFLLYRTLKLQQLGGGALSRSRPEDGLPMLVALLNIFSPHFYPNDVDRRKVAQAKVLVEQGLSRVGYDDDVPTLVLETIGAMGSQPNRCTEAPRLLATRTAMLATSGPTVALEALSAGAPKPLPESGPSRFRWIAAHEEARDAILFCTSGAFQNARARLIE